VKYVALLTNLQEDLDSWAEMSPAERQAARAEEVPKWEALFTGLGSTGVLGFGAELDDPSTAKTVRVRDGETIVTDGPFAETKEQLGGFYLLECGDLDEALAWARKIPMPGGTVEVRPVMDYEAAGSELHSNAAEAAR
jgi:hypothetical protein